MTYSVVGSYEFGVCSRICETRNYSKCYPFVVTIIWFRLQTRLISIRCIGVWSDNMTSFWAQGKKMIEYKCTDNNWSFLTNIQHHSLARLLLKFIRWVCCWQAGTFFLRVTVTRTIIFAYFIQLSETNVRWFH